MLQYSVLYCNRLQEAKLYRNTKLYCDSGLGAGRWLGTRGAGRARAERAGGALGMQAGRWAHGRARQARGRRAAGRGRARQARGRARQARGRARQARDRARGRKARGRKVAARGACAAGAR